MTAAGKRRLKAALERQARYKAWLKRYHLPHYWFYMVSAKEQRRMMRTGDCGEIMMASVTVRSA